MDEHLSTIREQLLKADEHLAAIRQAMAALKAAGMYPAVPLREGWETRGDVEYMWYYFSMGHNGRDYQGPGGKRKVYVGRDPQKIAAARQMAQNRRRWEELQQTASGLDGWLKSRHRELGRLAVDTRRWPRADLETLGLDLAAGGPSNSPNGQ